MGRFTEQIETLKQSQKAASEAINSKLSTGGGATYLLSELPDKIREIEVGPKVPILILPKEVSFGMLMEYGIRKDGDTVYSQSADPYSEGEVISVELTGGFGTYLIYPAVVMSGFTNRHAHVVVTENKEYTLGSNDFTYTDTHTMAPL